MKHICFIALSALLLAACSKDQKQGRPQVPVNNTIYGQWDLLATAQPFSQDTTWKYVRRVEDLSSIFLFENKSYISYKHPGIQLRGTFTITDSAGTNIKKIVLSNEGEPITLYLQLVESGFLKVDEEVVKNKATDYVSKRFGRRMECTTIW